MTSASGAGPLTLDLDHGVLAVGRMHAAEAGLRLLLQRLVRRLPRARSRRPARRARCTRETEGGRVRGEVREGLGRV
jgi:hypothetical protein